MSHTHHTVGSYLFDYLYSKGVRHAFGIPGDFALATFRWLDKSKIELLTLTHEPSVGFAADGYARVHGLGVACVTYCVGGLNMLNSVACAYAEKSPLVVISGGPSPNDRRSDSLVHHKVRTFDSQRRIFEEVTCANTVLSDPDTAAAEIRRVVDAVLSQCRPGYIEVPFDIVDQPIKLHPTHPEPAPQSDAENLAACLEEAVSKINQASQPVIVADIELHRHKLTKLVLDIAEKFGIPIASTLLSKSLIAETNPLYIGAYSGGLSEQACQDYVESSDCVILLGAFLSDVFMGLGMAPRLARKNTILVTTEKAQVGLHGYDRILLKDFLVGLAEAPIDRRPAFVNPNPAVEPEPLTKEEWSDPLTSAAFFRLLALHLPENSTLVCDAGDSLIGAVGIRTAKSNHFLGDAYYLSMGFAVPAAIGAMASNPHSRAFVVVGDGAFQMTGVELSTAAKYGMKPIVFVLNNDGYGTQRHIIDGPFNEILRWNYTKLCDLLGYGKAAQVRTKGELESILKQAVADDAMYLIEVIIPRDDCSEPLRRATENLSKARDSSKHG